MIITSIIATGTTTRLFPKVFMHADFEYHLKEAKHTKSFGWRGYYTCAFVRKRSCAAKIILSEYHGKLYPRPEEGKHTCNVQVVATENTTEIRGNATGEMKLLVEAKALANMSASAYQIADSVLEEMNVKYRGSS